MLEHGAVSLAEELENYVYRACEFITGVFQGYQVNDLLAMHEVDFFRVLARATARVKEQARHMKKAP